MGEQREEPSMKINEAEERRLKLDLIPKLRITSVARSLRSDDGENPEYDRALVELVMYTVGVSPDDRPVVVREVLGRQTSFPSPVDPIWSNPWITQCGEFA